MTFPVSDEGGRLAMAVDSSGIGVADGARLLWIDPRMLERSPNPRRRPVPEDRFLDLVASIKSRGILQPLIVRPRDEGTYQVVVGDNRQRAAIDADLAVVPCVVRSLSDIDVVELQLIENIQRNDMHPVDEGTAFRKLIDGKKHTVESLASTLGKSTRWIYNRLEFAKLIGGVREAFLDGAITATHAELLARLEPDDQERCLKDGLFEEVLGFDEKHARAVVSVAQLDAWIEQHVRLNIAAPAVQHLIPEVEEVQTVAAAEQAKVLQIATTLMLPREKGLRDKLAGVLTERQWKRAGGKSRCDTAERAVIVFGPGQGTVLDVCIDKTCAKHWPDHTPKAKEQRAKNREKDARTQTKAEGQRKREQEVRESRLARWQSLHPVLRTATLAAAKRLKTVPPKAFTAMLAAHRLPTSVRPADLPKALLLQTLEEMFRFTAFHYDDESKITVWATRLGVNVKQLTGAIDNKLTGVTEKKGTHGTKRT